MRVTLAAVGRTRDEPEAQLFEQYWKRAALSGPRLGFTGFDAAIIEISRRTSAIQRCSEEAEKLSRRMPANAHRIVLDERGRSLSSDEFAKQLSALRDRGVKDVAFVIGGPDGLSPDFRASAQQCLAFGAQTWPHLLVRAMLAEQIYRALTILSGHPYHRA
jgi:23S rRNA (pseudouridine1915-N3)-methyltransferase